MKEVLGSFKHTFGGGELRVTQVSNFKGEASVSIRKGKKIISYDYNIKVKWECIFRDGEGNEVGMIKGEYEMPEVSNDIEDDGDDWEVKPTVSDDKNNLKSRYENIWRKEAPNQFRKAIREKFVAELKQK